MPNQDEPAELYEAFICTTQNIVNQRVKAMNGTAKSRAEKMAEKLFGQLRSSDALNAMRDALEGLENASHDYDWPNGKGEVVHALLLEEMRLFNAIHAGANRACKGLEDADTVKGSIEDLLSPCLPQWLKKLLKLLNQLLHLLRP